MTTAATTARTADFLRGYREFKPGMTLHHCPVGVPTFPLEMSDSDMERYRGFAQAWKDYAEKRRDYES